MLFYVVVAISIVTVYSKENSTFTVFEKIKSGLKMAGDFLTSEYASTIANLVSSTFETSHFKKTKGDSGNNIFAGFLRLFGFDIKKIGAITVNAIIVVAQLISSSLPLKQASKLEDQKSFNHGSPYDWMINNANISEVFKIAKDELLPKKVIEYIKELNTDEETGCVQLLICKISPFVKNMQTALADKNDQQFRGRDAFFTYLPTVDVIADYGDECEKEYPFCTYL